MTSTAPPRPEEPTVPKRRNTELVLTMFAVAIAMFAYANVGLADNGQLPAGMWGYGAGLGAIVLVAHLVIRFAAPYADPLFLPLATMLNGVGLVLIHRLDLVDQNRARILRKTDPKVHIPTGATSNQLMFTALGIIVFAGILLMIKDHRILQRYAYISMVVGLFLVALPAMLPASMSSVNGAKSWVLVGGFSLQPAEFGKLLLVSFFAAYFMAKRDALRIASRKFLGLHFPRGRDLGPIAVCWAVAMFVLFFESDFGVSLMFFGAFVILLYIATERTSWLVFGIAMFLGGATLIATLTTHVQTRVTAWLHPFDVETTGKGTNQIAQSLYGFASGGIFGRGLDQGRPDLVGFAKNADFILVTVGEELGMIGLFALMMVYTLIVMRGFKTALLIRDSYGKLLASGLAVTFALQVFITAGGVMRVIPLTGLPMPFLAAGGSALVANWVLIAALIRLSDVARRPPPPAIPLTEEELRAMRLAVAVRPSAPAPKPVSAPVPASVPVPVSVPAAAKNEPVGSGLDDEALKSANEPTQVVRPASAPAEEDLDESFDADFDADFEDDFAAEDDAADYPTEYHAGYDDADDGSDDEGRTGPDEEATAVVKPAPRPDQAERRYGP